jgi:hypothetical protein
MTRKHFNQIADAMRYMRKIEIDDVEGSATGVRVVKFSSVVDVLAGILADSNPRFDRDRFLGACGIGTSASDGGLKRDAAKAKAKRSAAREAIEREDTVCFDVAAEHGQIFGNVKGMKWFVDAVAESL